MKRARIRAPEIHPAISLRIAVPPRRLHNVGVFDTDHADPEEQHQRSRPRAIQDRAPGERRKDERDDVKDAGRQNPDPAGGEQRGHDPGEAVIGDERHEQDQSRKRRQAEPQFGFHGIRPSRACPDGLWAMDTPPLAVRQLAVRPTGHSALKYRALMGRRF